MGKGQIYRLEKRQWKEFRQEPGHTEEQEVHLLNAQSRRFC